MESFAQLLARAERAGSSADVIALLRQARTHRVPATHNATVLKWGAHALSKCRAALGDELWSVYEQTLLAALAAHDDALADACAEALDARFGDSTRVKRLLAMRDEAAGEYADADEARARAARRSLEGGRRGYEAEAPNPSPSRRCTARCSTPTPRTPSCRSGASRSCAPRGSSRRARSC